MLRYAGADKSGIIRVYGYGSDRHEAWTQCEQAVKEYVRARPDTGPVASWLIDEYPENA